FRDDVRFALRATSKGASTTAFAVLALAIGIGAAASIFGVLDAVLLRPLPYARPDRLVTVLEDGQRPVSPANFLDWQRQSKTLARMGAAEAWSPDLTGGSGAPETV